MRNTLAMIALLSLAACAHQPELPHFGSVPGFLSGIWHGLIAPLAFIGSIFSDVRMYAYPNSGVWYDFGFLLGIAAWGGGAVASR